MKRRTDSVTKLRQPDDREELARLKRLTGLDFGSVPDSLLDPQRDPVAGATDDADTLYRATSRPARP